MPKGADEVQTLPFSSPTKQDVTFGHELESTAAGWIVVDVAHVEELAEAVDVASTCPARSVTRQWLASAHDTELSICTSGSAVAFQEDAAPVGLVVVHASSWLSMATQKLVVGQETPTNGDVPVGLTVVQPGESVNGAVEKMMAPLASTLTQRLSEGQEIPVMAFWPIWKTHQEVGSAAVAESPTSPEEVPTMQLPSLVHADDCMEGVQVT